MLGGLPLHKHTALCSHLSGHILPAGPEITEKKGGKKTHTVQAHKKKAGCCCRILPPEGADNVPTSSPFWLEPKIPSGVGQEQVSGCWIEEGEGAKRQQ